MPELKLLFLQILVILLVAKILAAVFRLIRQPEVLGEMAAGILLGPSLLGKFAPEMMNALFPSSSLGPLYALSQLGLVLFMFLVGWKCGWVCCGTRRARRFWPAWRATRDRSSAEQSWRYGCTRIWETAQRNFRLFSSLARR